MLLTIPHHDRHLEPPREHEPAPSACCDGRRTERDEEHGSPLCEACRAEERRP